MSVCLSVSCSDTVSLVSSLLHSLIKILNKEVRKRRKSEAYPRAQDIVRKNLTKPLQSIQHFLIYSCDKQPKVHIGPIAGVCYQGQNLGYRLMKDQNLERLLIYLNTIGKCKTPPTSCCSNDPESLGYKGLGCLLLLP